MNNDVKNLQVSRRNLIKGISLGVGSFFLSSPIFALSKSFPNKSKSQKKDKMGIALVGLGQYSANQLAPALLETEHCYLAGIVTGTETKVAEWQETYDIPDENVYNYENFDEIATNDAIDIVYIVLPISMHAEFTIRAAKAKKHVICEKPMAMNVEEATQMVEACKENGVKLAIGYRLHFEPFNRKSMELGQQEAFGKVNNIVARNSSDKTSGPPDVWRLRKDLAGGGPLMDMGIYCVQAACYSKAQSPIAVTAEFGEVTKPTYFYEVEESIKWTMEFEDGATATCESSYHDSEESGTLEVKSENGWWKLQPAYTYDGKEGETQEGKLDLPNVFEQVHQMDGQAKSFLENKESIVPGEMGLHDMKILMAIYESANNNGKRVTLDLDYFNHYKLQEMSTTQ